MMLKSSHFKSLTLLRINNKALLLNNTCSKRLYARDNDDEIKDYEKNMNEMINQVNEELISERMDINNKFLEQKLKAEEELKQKS